MPFKRIGRQGFCSIADTLAKALSVFAIMASVLLCSCATAPVVPSPQHQAIVDALPDGYRIAVLSLIGNELEMYKEGFTNLDSSIKQVDVSAWKMDDFVTEAVKNMKH